MENVNSPGANIIMKSTSLRRKTLYGGKIFGPKRYRCREVLLYIKTYRMQVVFILFDLHIIVTN